MKQLHSPLEQVRPNSGRATLVTISRTFCVLFVLLP